MLSNHYESLDSGFRDGVGRGLLAKFSLVVVTQVLTLQEFIQLHIMLYILYTYLSPMGFCFIYNKKNFLKRLQMSALALKPACQQSI